MLIDRQILFTTKFFLLSQVSFCYLHTHPFTFFVLFHTLFPFFSSHDIDDTRAKHISETKALKGLAKLCTIKMKHKRVR